MLQLLKEATAAQAKEAARKRQLAEGQVCQLSVCFVSHDISTKEPSWSDFEQALATDFLYC